MKEKAAKIYSVLSRQYPGSETALEFHNPLEMLVSTILSAQCTDVRVNIVTGKLFKKYRSVKDYAIADIRELEQDIRSTGYYKSKARNINNAAKLIISRFKGKVPDKMEGLVALPGVGRKTANIVLWNSFGISNGIAVDTHVTRLSFRLGLTKNTDPEKIEQDLMKLFSEKQWPNVSNLLIDHGRAICNAKKPLCRQCPLYSLCPKSGVDRKFYS